METRTIKVEGTEKVINDVYTMKDWENDRTLKVKEGQTIEPSVFWSLLNSLPPQTYGRTLFQPGEPYDHDWNTGRALYRTFEHVGEYYYKYIGLKPAI